MRSILLALSSCVFTGGCVLGVDPGPPQPVGTLTVEWTVNGTKDPRECRREGAVTLDVTVETLDGDPMGEYREACTDFATSIHLPPGRYMASALLLDGTGADRTTIIPVTPFVILRADDLDVPLDFPERSFR